VGIAGPEVFSNIEGWGIMGDEAEQDGLGRHQEPNVWRTGWEGELIFLLLFLLGPVSRNGWKKAPLSTAISSVTKQD
jgi:hypothetical protein